MEVSKKTEKLANVILLPIAVKRRERGSCSFRAQKYGENEKKCKHAADCKMVNALNAVPWRKRQWGHALARNAIATKCQLGLGR